jgi:hypothetical protein
MFMSCAAQTVEENHNQQLGKLTNTSPATPAEEECALCTFKTMNSSAINEPPIGNKLKQGAKLFPHSSSQLICTCCYSTVYHAKVNHDHDQLKCKKNQDGTIACKYSIKDIRDAFVSGRSDDKRAVLVCCKMRYARSLGLDETGYFFP